MDAAIFLVRILAETGMIAEINPGRVHRLGMNNHEACKRTSGSIQSSADW
jgi:hypothetical protein